MRYEIRSWKYIHPTRNPEPGTQDGRLELALELELELLLNPP
jgi:hypothetical protein